jgi:transcription elongation factor Elf1
VLSAMLGAWRLRTKTMPSNDNQEDYQICDFCGHNQFVLADDEYETIVKCATCGIDHLTMNIVVR